ncbi:hypothetical protein L6452_34352 [Arctium lappa]|uniref:Uncharacterized protein n=1 Tax=Arctium lappa TaxID=4217 RepID=A0ACB8YIJ8_ARCLA|nr:hypothetical protein L6452_34352 [Arctium lappa]
MGVNSVWFRSFSKRATWLHGLKTRSSREVGRALTFFLGSLEGEDVEEAKDAKKKANAQIKSLSSPLQICFSQQKHFDNIKAELEDLKTNNFTFAKEKNKLLKKFKKEQEIVKRWTSSSKSLERIFQDQMPCDDKSGLGFGNYDLDPPSDTHAPFSLPSFYESSEENSDNCEPLDFSDLSKNLKFGIFVMLKKINTKIPSSTPLANSDKGILGPKPLDSSLSSKARKVNVTSHHKEADQSFKRGLGYQQIWYLDSGCSRHMIDIKSLLVDFVTTKGPSVTFGDNSRRSTKGKLTKSSFMSKQCFSISQPLQMLHMDLCRPVSTPSLGGRRKLDPKDDEGIFVGYSLTSKAFKVNNLIRKCIDKSIHVKFDDLRTSSLSFLTSLYQNNDPSTSVNPSSFQEDNPQPTQPQNTLQIILVSQPDIPSSPIPADLPSLSPENFPSDSPLQISFHPPLPPTIKWTKNHPIDQIIGDQQAGVQTRRGFGNICLYVNFLSLTEPKKFEEALADPCSITAMQEEISQFERGWCRPFLKRVLETKLTFSDLQMRFEIGTILADGVDQIGMLGFRLISQSSIRFERYTSSLSFSADLRLHRTFVLKPNFL